MKTMKTMKQLSLAIMALSFILSSCSIEKRQYMQGYNISWKNSNSKNVNGANNNTAHNQKVIEKTTPFSIAEVDKVEILSEINYQIKENNYSASTDESIVLPLATKLDWAKKAKKVIASNEMSKSEVKAIVKQKISQSIKKQKGEKPPIGLLYLLCFLIPVVAVGLATDWDVMPMVYNLLWTLLCGIPGIIHAIIVVSKNK
jgi:uncharacterized membrane protein YqaE (UPF0057 family)